ncbi:hypothetical protein [uncultured Campylobacter sp.]|uniref:hypothetical protein n=1 Tax=uncultured Campylobacter sp. TaxID=218934 RepID=UPI00263123CA|nr:hypothetical protein [uncultured Campylobacter sp.]
MKKPHIATRLDNKFSHYKASTAIRIQAQRSKILFMAYNIAVYKISTHSTKHKKFYCHLSSAAQISF